MRAFTYSICGANPMEASFTLRRLDMQSPNSKYFTLGTFRLYGYVYE